MAWRGTVPERALPAATRERFADAITYQVLKDSHILVYPIPGLDGALTGVAEPFVQVVYDIAVPRMAFGRVGLIGDGPGN